jgi:cell division protein FtsB
MTVEEADKINELYKQIDELTAENKTLKEHVSHDHSELLDRLTSIEQKLDGGKK